MDTDGDFFGDVHAQRHWESFEDWWCGERVTEMAEDGKGGQKRHALGERWLDMISINALICRTLQLTSISLVKSS